VTKELVSDARRLPIALVVATEFEARIVERSLSKSRNSSVSHSEFEVVQVGVACCAIDAEELGEAYSAVISTGFAGALAAGVKSGTLIEPNHIVAADNTCYSPDTALQQKIVGGSRESVANGALLHTNHLLASVADKQNAFEHSQCIACDMESGTLAFIARQSGRPFACLRIVLDPAATPVPAPILSLSDPEAPSSNDPSAGAFLKAILKQPSQLPATAVFLWHTRKATKALTQALTELFARCQN